MQETEAKKELCEPCDEKKSPARPADAPPAQRKTIRQNARFRSAGLLFHGLPGHVRWWRALTPATRWWVGLPARTLAGLAALAARTLWIIPRSFWRVLVGIADTAGVAGPMRRWRARVRQSNQRYPGCGCTVIGKALWLWLREVAVSFVRPVACRPTPIEIMTHGDIFTGTLPERKPKQPTTERPPAPEGTPAPPPVSASAWGAQ